MYLVEEAGSPLHRLEPGLTPEKIEHIYKVDKGEKLGTVFTEEDVEARVRSELALYERLTAGCRDHRLQPDRAPLDTHPTDSTGVVIQSTWLPESALGMIPPSPQEPFKSLLTKTFLVGAKILGGPTPLHPINRVARRCHVKPFDNMFSSWRGNGTLPAEPPGFGNAKQLPTRLLRRAADRPGGFSHPPEVLNVPRDLPAHKVNAMADISVIHGGIGTVVAAALAGKQVVGMGMMIEQDANLGCLVRQGFAIRIPKGRANASRILAAVEKLLHDGSAKQKARDFAAVVTQWDGPSRAARFFTQKHGGK